MLKVELEKLLEELGINVSEGIQNDNATNGFPRLVYWEYLWTPLTSSGKEYNTKVTYQVSIFYQIPREEKLLKLKNKLNELGIYPEIQHEYIQKGKYFHSFFAIEVLENV